LDSQSHANGTLQLSFTQSCPQTPDGVEKQPFVIPLRVAFYTAEGKPLEGMTDLLVMTQATQVFEVHGLSAPPLVSLLRDFSAPVHLQRDLSVDDCLLLLRCESNGYCKWDAGLRVAQRVVAASYASALANDWQWDDLGLFEAQRDILNHDALDLALRAELVMPVGYHLLAESLTEVDIDCFERVRDYFNQSQARTLSDDAWCWYERLWAEEDHAMHGHAYNRRRLRNVCLHVMMKSGNLDAVNRCEQQFTAARTMTDQLASFSLLVNDADDARHADAIARFYHQWQHEPLVMDKWFSVQAACERDGALARVETLMQHPLFTLKNPNKVRALLGVFCQNNRRHFHAKDGSGYQFLAHCLLQLDAINAQIAARLATPFTQWQRVDKSRQAMMQKQLQQLSDANLSNDLREIIDKSLVV
jgi:aminopeptidase N